MRRGDREAARNATEILLTTPLRSSHGENRLSSRAMIKAAKIIAPKLALCRIEV